MCGEYVQRTGQYFYISNFNPLIIETNNSNSNLLRKCQPKLEVQTLCYQIKYLKVNFKQIYCLICNNTSLTNYDILKTFKLPIIYYRDLNFPYHKVKHYTSFVFEMSLFITCYIVLLLYPTGERLSLSGWRQGPCSHCGYLEIKTEKTVHRKIS